MRILFALCLLGCSNEAIQPEPDAGPKKVLPDAAVPDAATEGGTPNPGWTSGSRLRARTFDGKDGSKQFAGWYDSMRMESCEYGYASDGSLRCLPTVEQVSQISTVYFKDGQCTQPYAVVIRGCTPRYAISTSNSCAHPPTRIFAAGTLTNVNAYVLSNGCSGPLPIPTSIDLWTPGAEIPAASFQDAQENHE